jgi:saccharopine dehydrogenase-like NADP-dependent oxidoreductase
MARIVVLGGAGGIGSIAARALATFDEIGDLVVADVNLDAAAAVADGLGGGRASAAAVDAATPESLAAAVRGADVVLNCVGPFYRFGPPILEAAIAAGVDYVDVCDDLDATVAMLGLDGAAQSAGVRALIGMGNSPGLANVLVRFCADHLLDRVDSADIMHVHGGEPDEGPGVLKHRIHAMTSDVPLFLDGEFTSVRMLEPSGQAHARETEFPDVGTCTVHPYPHPETITLPRHIAGLRRATNLGAVVPAEYFALTMDAVRLGICTEEPIGFGGERVVPRDFAVAYLRARRPGLLAAAGLTAPRGCLKVEVAGEKDGAAHRFVFSMSSGAAGAGEGTGIPAALGAMLMLRGQAGGPGVLPPEAAVDPVELIELARQVVPHFGMGGGLPLTLEHHDPAGAVSRIDLPL